MQPSPGTQPARYWFSNGSDQQGGEGLGGEGLGGGGEGLGGDGLGGGGDGLGGGGEGGGGGDEGEGGGGRDGLGGGSEGGDWGDHDHAKSLIVIVCPPPWPSLYLNSRSLMPAGSWIVSEKGVRPGRGAKGLV